MQKGALSSRISIFKIISIFTIDIAIAAQDMQNIIIYPTSQNQLAEIKSILERKRIRFDLVQETISEKLEDWQIKMIEEGLNDIENGKTAPAADVHQKALALCKKA